jgi:photosystem II stability/assembly factor-like uncharacterized protein
MLSIFKRWMIYSILIVLLCSLSACSSYSKPSANVTPQNSPIQKKSIELTNEKYGYHLVLPAGWQAVATDGTNLKESTNITLKNLESSDEINIGICRGEYSCGNSHGTVTTEKKEPVILDGTSAILFHNIDKTADGSQSNSQHIEAVKNGYTYDIYMLLKSDQNEFPQAFAEVIRDWKWIQSEQTNARSTAAARLSSFRMVDDLHGWALSIDEAILFTSDGGEQWTDKTPQGVQLKGATISSFYNSGTAWIAQYSEEKKQIEVFHTTDSGATWKEADIQNPTKSGLLLYPTSLEFLDAKTGWLSITPDHGMNSSPGLLLATIDGGEHWIKISETGDSQQGTSNHMPFGGYARFSSPKQGWLVGTPYSTGIAKLYYTENSGRNWNKVDLPLPEGIKDGQVDAKVPLFFSNQSKKGLISATFRPTDGETAKFRTIIYETTDNGRTWHGRLLPVEISSVYSISAYADTQHWFIWDSDSSSIPVKGKLYRSDNSGRNWTEIKLDQTLTTELSKNETITEMQFTSVQNGWARLENPNQTFTKLLKTIDGGQTWIAVNTELVSK